MIARFRAGLVIIAACATLVAVARAQSVNPSQLLAPPPDSWLTFHGDYTGQRHSKLSQITPANVNQLGLAWAFQTNPVSYTHLTLPTKRIV